MRVDISETKQEMGGKAAADGAACIRDALAARGSANIILATGASQFEMLGALVKQEGIDWSRVHCFHLDEYAGMPLSHPASFRKYLKERFVEELPGAPAAFHYTCPSMIRPPTLKPNNLIWSSIWTKPAGDSNWAKAGSPLWMMCRNRPFPCP